MARPVPVKPAAPKPPSKRPVDMNKKIGPKPRNKRGVMTHQ